MRIALVSLNQVWENKEENFLTCRSYVQSAKVQDVELVIFPEMTLTAFSMNTEVTAEDSSCSLTVDSFKKLAEEFQVAIIFGVVFRDNEKATNNAILVDKTGSVKDSYRKIHPFSFTGEDKLFDGGNKISFSKIGQINIGLTICYDLRFPEIYSALGRSCELIINIANWPARRVEHWNSLLKARAIENQLFIVGVNRTGTDGMGLAYVKSSQAINPNGDLLIPVIFNEYLDIFDIDPEYIVQFKKTFSTTQDRKHVLYKSIL